MATDGTEVTINILITFLENVINQILRIYGYVN